MVEQPLIAVQSIKLAHTQHIPQPIHPHHTVLRLTRNHHLAEIHPPAHKHRHTRTRTLQQPQILLRRNQPAPRRQLPITLVIRIHKNPKSQIIAIP